MEKYLAIDIGGTAVKAATLDSHNNILEKITFDTKAHLGSTYLLDNIFNKLNALDLSDLMGIGISATGQINSKDGSVIFATNIIPNWIGTNIKDYFEERYEVPTIVENDVNCVAYAHRDLHRDFVCIALGTGIGCGIVLDGQVFHGSKGIAGEIGHIPIVKDGRVCNCGRRGCYEAYASTSALVKIAHERIGTSEKLNGKIIFEREKNGDKIYKEIVDLWIDYITDGFVSIITILNPPLIIIGGGVSGQGNYLIEKIKKSLEGKVMPSFLKDLKIQSSNLANDAGILGAYYLIREKV